MFRLASSAMLALAISHTQAVAQEVKITPDVATATIEINGEIIQIGRIQDTDNRLDGEFTKTSRPCPPFCISPMEVAPGVETVGEVEVISFLENTWRAARAC